MKTPNTTRAADARGTGHVGLWCALLAAVAVLPASAADNVVLVKDGQPAATIVVADVPIAVPLLRGQERLTVRHAAEELQLLLEKATGAKLPIAKESEAPVEGTLILVGRSGLTQKYGIALPNAPEGLRVAVFERGLAFVGEVAEKGTNNIEYELDRGTLFGVYEFLERALGFRFYTHVKNDPFFGMVVPALRTVTVPRDYELVLTPDFQYRGAGFATWEDPPGWNRVTREGCSTGFHANHTDEHWGQRYRKEHPEHFLLHKDGTRDDKVLCYTEPSVLDQRMRDIEEFYKSGKWGTGWNPPRERYIPFVPADIWGKVCRTPGCQALINKTRGRWGVTSDIIFSHGAGIAREVAKRWPNRRVAMLAYEAYMEVPDLELPENLDVMVCLMRSVTIGKEEKVHAYNMDLMKRWSRKVGGRRDRLYVWNYWCWPAQWSKAPTFFPHYLKKWLQDTHEIQSGEFINPGAGPQFDMFMCYLWHRLMWDRNTDVDALLAEHTRLFFGPAAEPAKAMYDLLIDRWENVKWGWEGDFCIMPAELTYGKTYTPDVVARSKTLADAIVAACPADPEDLFRRRALWFREGMLPFFREADAAHHWMASPPAYTVKAVAAVPANDDAWAALPALSLTEGDFGLDPDLKTRARLARAGDTLHVRLECEEPTPLQPDDKLELAVIQRASEVGQSRKKETRLGEDEEEDKPPAAVAIWGPSPTNGTLDITLVESRHTNGLWMTHVAFPAKALELEAGKKGMAAVQIKRQRGERKAVAPAASAPRRRFQWAPRLAPHYSDDPPPAGLLTVESAP